jgi:hypothetical protein
VTANAAMGHGPWRSKTTRKLLMSDSEYLLNVVVVGKHVMKVYASPERFLFGTEVGVLKKLSLAGLAQLSRLR